MHIVCAKFLPEAVYYENPKFCDRFVLVKNRVRNEKKCTLCKRKIGLLHGRFLLLRFTVISPPCCLLYRRLRRQMPGTFVRLALPSTLWDDVLLSDAASF